MKRIARHYGASPCGEGEMACLALHPIFPGERGMHLSVQATAMTGQQPGAKEGDPYIKASADSPPECNWYMLHVPWLLLGSYLKDTANGNPESLGIATSWPTTQTQWVDRLRDLLFERDPDSSQYFGGDVDLGDEVDAGADNVGDDPLIDGQFMGPLGVRRLFSRETWMRPWGSDDTGNTRFWDDWSVSMDLALPPGVLAIVVLRYDIAVDTNYNVQWQDTTKIEAMQRLLGGDLSRNNHMLQTDSGAVSDAMRTMLFGGDNYLTNIGSGRQHPATFNVKSAFTVSTPYSHLDG